MFWVFVDWVLILNIEVQNRTDMWEVTLWVIKNPIESEETTAIEYLIDANDEFEATDKAKKQCPYSVYDSEATKY